MAVRLQEVRAAHFARHSETLRMRLFELVRTFLLVLLVMWRLKRFVQFFL